MFIFQQKSNYPIFFTLPIIIFFSIIFYDCLNSDWNIRAFWIAFINTAIHEWWHILFSFSWNTFLHIAWWTIMQLLIPILIMIWFIKQRDFFWVSVIFSILSINLFGISFYCLDAIKWTAPLLKLFWDRFNYIHDWSYMLIEMWILHKADDISLWIWILAILCYVIFIIYSFILIINRFRDWEL